MFEIIAALAGPIIGGLTGSKSADKASAAQQQGDAAAIEEQRRQFDLNRSDLAPFREAGSAATMRLRELMGLGSSGAAVPGGVGTGGASGPSGGSVESREAIRARLLPQFTTETPSFAARNPQFGTPGNRPRSLAERAQDAEALELIDGGPPSRSMINEAALNAAIDAEMARQSSRGVAPASGDPYQIYGDAPLLRRFTVGDFWNDPVTKLGLQFGLDRGTRGIEQNAARSGMRHSGNTLKALTQFGTDYVGTKAGESQNRFTNEQQNVYNRLAGLGGSGQSAANNTVAAGTNMANNVSNIMSSGGNARGAAAIAGGNALSGAGTSISNWWNQKNLMDRIFPTGGGGSFIPSTFGYDSAGGPAYG